MKLVLIGIQGAGKSTQGNMLSDMLKVPYLSSGHIFREMSKDEGDTGKYIRETLNKGDLIPDEKAIKIITEYLSRPEYAKGYILDGFPRTVPQAEIFGDQVDHVIYIDVSDKEALWRIASRVSDREDETLPAIKRRIQLFHEQTEPVIDFYRDRGKLIQVDGEKSVEHVFDQIMKFLK